MSDCLSPRSVICTKGAGRLRKESGVTVLMVAVGMFALLSMAIISLDVVNVYVASNQAQKAADAAALAGAEALASSGITSYPSSVPLSLVCNLGGDADLRAQAVAAQNTIAGLPPSPKTVTTSCPSTNPQIQVIVTRTDIPTFFARMWGKTTTTVSATAVAEAYNPSNDPANPPPYQPPISIHGVKPWLVFNCNTCSGGPLFFTSGYGIVNPVSFIGQQFKLNLTDTKNPIPPAPAPDPAPKTAQFYAIDPPQQAQQAPLACPSSTTAVSCDHIGTDPPNIYYHDNIACEGGFVFGNGNGQQISVGPGQPIQLDTDTLVGTLGTRTQFGTECLIHASTTGLGQGQDSFTAGPPVTIIGGSNNPNKSLQPAGGVKVIHRSDSVVTVPVFNCPTSGPCDQTVSLLIVGFLQLGIQDVDGSGNLDAVILNAAGSDPASQGTPITGAGTSPVPVRLVHQ